MTHRHELSDGHGDGSTEGPSGGSGDGVVPVAPIRTCVGCRQRAPASVLLRVVAVTDPAGPTGGYRLVPDPARRLPGRGAHLHPDPRCLALAQRRRAFGRALRLSGVADDGELVELIDPGPQGTEDRRT